jgi:hypothetical protein
MANRYLQAKRSGRIKIRVSNGLAFSSTYYVATVRQGSYVLAVTQSQESREAAVQLAVAMVRGRRHAALTWEGVEHA